MEIGVVTGRTTAAHLNGEQPGRLLQVVLTDFNDIQTVEMPQSGDEYNPPDGVRVVIERGGTAYPMAVTSDDSILPVMLPGGRRLYSTAPDGGTVRAELRLHPDGKVELFNGEAALTMHPDGRAVVANDNASITMNADGTFVIHGAGTTFDHPVHIAGAVTTDSTITAAGDITAPTVKGTTDVLFATKSALHHKHTAGGNEPI